MSKRESLLEFGIIENIEARGEIPRLIILVGRSGAGKTEFSKAMNSPENHFVISASIEDKLRNKGIEVSHDSIQAIAHERYTSDPYWQVPIILNILEERKFLILDGPRSASEIRKLKEVCSETLVIRVETEASTRHERLLARDGVSDDEFERIEKDESEETELEDILENLVDVTIINGGPLEYLQDVAKQLSDFLR